MQPLAQLRRDVDSPAFIRQDPPILSWRAAGEAMKISYLHSAGAPLKDAAVLTVLDRFFDVFWIGLFALPSVFFLLREQFFALALVLLAIAIGLIVVIRIVSKIFGTVGHLITAGLQWKPHWCPVA